MSVDPLTPHAWLAESPLRDNERLYLVVSAASDARPIRDFHLQDMAPMLLPVWSGTPYADWDDLMPFVAELQPGAGCLQWIADTTTRDWGWLAVSICSPEQVRAHLRSLTRVYMPDGTQVFFRFWDGQHLLAVLEGLGDGADAPMPVFRRYLINGQPLQTGTRPVPAVRDWPWWQVPETLLAGLTADNPAMLAGDLLLWLRQAHADLYSALPVACLQAKLTRFVRLAHANETDLQQDLATPLLAWLQQEIQP